MPRFKKDLSRVSINQLMTLTGKSYRTLKKLLADVNPEVDPEDNAVAILYDPVRVLPVIYAPPVSTFGSDGILDPIQEKARLDKLKADKVQIEIDVMKGKLVPADKVESTWSAMVGACRSKILGLPTKIAPRVKAARTVPEIENLLKKECREALAELADYDGNAGAEASPGRG